MNHVSMNNVAMTETLAWIVALRGVKQTVKRAEYLLEIERAACCAASWTGFGAGCCTALSNLLAWYVSPLKKAVNNQLYENLISENSAISLWKIMRALQYMNKSIVLAYPGIGEADAFHVARKNKARFAVLIPYPGLNAPLKETAFCDLCDPTLNGSRTDHHRGYEPLLRYDRNQGPLKRRMDALQHIFWPAITVGGPYLFKYTTKSNFNSLCGDCLGERPVRHYNVTSNYNVAREAPHVESSCWFYMRATYGPTPEPELGGTILPDPPCEIDGKSENDDFERLPGQTVQCPGYLSGSREYRDARASKQFFKGLGTSMFTLQGYRDIGQGIWSKSSREEVTDASGNVTYTYRIEQYRFGFAKTNIANDEEAEDMTRGLDRSTLPAPTMLTTIKVNELLEKLSYVCIAYKPKRQLPFEKFLSNPNTLAYVGYAQVLVYNPTAVDMFTQDWHVKLVPANRLSNALSLLKDAANRLPDGAGADTGILDEITNVLNVDLAFLNHH
jgi:hypothetical protein